MIRLSFILVIIFLSQFSFSQETTEQTVRPKQYIYFNPGALINVPSGIQVGYERKLNARTYWDIEGGILIYSKNAPITDFNATNKSGFRFQTGTRKFTGDHFFIGLEFLFKRVSMDEREWLWRFDNTYERLFEVHRVRRTVAMALDIGWSYDLGDSPLALDIVYGLGIQNLHVRYDALPEDVSFENFGRVSTRPGNSMLPFFNFRIKLKYALEDKKDTRKKRSSKKLRDQAVNF